MSDPVQTPVVIVDIDMPFWSMVTFIFKWTLAAIPALLVLTVLGALVTLTIGALGMAMSLRP